MQGKLAINSYTIVFPKCIESAVVPGVTTLSRTVADRAELARTWLQIRDSISNGTGLRTE